MKKTMWTLVAGAILVASSIGWTAGKPAETTGDETLATIGGVPITAAEVEEKLAGRLQALRSQEYDLKTQGIEEIVSERLLAAEAKARNITVDELVQQEVTAKAAPVTEAEVKAQYEQVKSRIPPNVTEAEALKRIESNMQQQRTGIRRAEFVKDLRAKSSVRILLEPPRVAVTADNTRSKGPQAAPVTIVEFSDFECPFCSRVLPTIKQVQEKYGDKVRIAFRDFPLPMHKQAPKAAEAAYCADEQGKFWEMHDVLFANQQKLKPEELKQHATGIGLDAEKFNQCLDSGKHDASWKRDMEQGQRYGVNGTPAFFINGRMISGAQPYEAFARIIDEELERAAPVAKAAAGAAAKPKTE